MGPAEAESLAETRLPPLLSHLAARRPLAPATWREWSIVPMGGGANNLLYRVQGEQQDLVAKFTMRDERDRAGREFGALMALAQAGLAVAPLPVLLDRDSYELPVVVQTYLPGEVSAAPPATDGEWQRLLEHLLTVHSLAPDRDNNALPVVWSGARSAGEALRLVHSQVQRLPEGERPAVLIRLLQRLDEEAPRPWPSPTLGLCRSDLNTGNFVRRPGAWASVDWEYAGWGDPAFDVADLITHPAYLDVPDERWRRLAAEYAASSGDRGCVHRVGVYARALAVYWVARLARQRFGAPLDLDKRLVAPPPEWETDWQRKVDHYVGMAERLLSQRDEC